MATSMAGVIRHALTTGAGNATPVKPASVSIPYPVPLGAGDNRPDTSGRVPNVHYDIPLYTDPQNTGYNTTPWNFFPNLDPGGVVSGAAKYIFNPLGLVGSATGNTDAQDVGGVPSGLAKYLFSPYGLPGAVAGHTDFSGDLFKLFGGWFGGGTKTPAGKPPKTVALGPGSNKAPKGAKGAAGGAAGGVDAAVIKALGQGPGTVQPPTFQKVPGVSVPGVDPNRAAFENNLLASSLQNGNIDFASLIKQAGPIAAAAYAPYIKSLLASGAMGANTIQGYTRGAEQALAGIGRDVGQNYANAEAVQGQISKGIESGFGAMNPNKQDQSLLGAYGIDQTTRDQIGNQNKQSFDTTGKVVGDIGLLNASSLAAQGAANKSFVDTLPALLRNSGLQALASQNMGTTSALAKVAAEAGKTGLSLAGQMASAESKKAANQMSAYKALQGADIREQGLGLQAQTANQSATIRNNAQAASNYYKAIGANNSAETNRIARGRLALSIYKANNPTASAKTSTAAANAARSFFEKAAGFIPTGSKAKPYLDKGSQTTKFRNQPTYSHKSYQQAIGEYIASGGDPNVAVNMANSVWSYGYGGRDFEQPIKAVLSAAGAKTSPHFEVGEVMLPSGAILSKVATITLQQAQALNAGGFADFAHALQPGHLPNGDQVFIIPKLRG